MKTAIVWFKTDLRLDDNEAPLKANRPTLRRCDCVCTTLMVNKTQILVSFYRVWSDLDKNLTKVGFWLHLANQKLKSKLLPYKAKISGFAKREVASKKTNRKEVQESIDLSRCELETFSTSTLYHAEDLPLPKNIPDVFYAV
jgi:deoxyribodipyrimidine photo-lyase